VTPASTSAQSDSIVVKNNEVFENVAGIEIENSFNADVHDNNSHDNTVGFLVFDLAQPAAGRRKPHPRVQQPVRQQQHPELRRSGRDGRARSRPARAAR
jgi:hypothetical protein